MKIVAVVCLLILSFNLKAQSRDTIVCDKKYFILAWHQNGFAKELGQTTDSVKNGAWIYLDETGKIVRTGHFKNNLKNGWWGNGTTRFIIYKNGKQTAVGKGCWCCPDF